MGRFSDFLIKFCKIGEFIKVIFFNLEFWKTDKAHCLKNFPGWIKKQLLHKDVKLAGDGADKMPGAIVKKLGDQLKTEVSKAIKLAKDYHDKEVAVAEVQHHFLNVQAHLNGDHSQCPEKAKCGDDHIFKPKSEVLNKKYEALQEKIFNSKILTSKWIEKNIVASGSTSGNESTHACMWNRGFNRKNTSNKIHTNFLESAQAMTSLFINLGDAKATAALVPGLHPAAKVALESHQNQANRSKSKIYRDHAKRRQKVNDQKQSTNVSKTQAKTGFYDFLNKNEI